MAYLDINNRAKSDFVECAENARFGLPFQLMLAYL